MDSKNDFVKYDLEQLFTLYKSDDFSMLVWMSLHDSWFIKALKCENMNIMNWLIVYFACDAHYELRSFEIRSLPF